jgi:leucyl aminopeptidase
MNLSLVSGEAAPAGGELLVLPLFEEELGEARPEVLTSTDTALEGRLLKAAAQEGFKGKADQSFTLHTLGRLEAERVLLLGLGARARYTPEVLRLAAGRAAKAAQRARLRSLSLALPAVEDLAAAFQAAVEGMELGAYRFDRYKSSSKEEKEPPRLGTVRLMLPPGASRSKEHDEVVAHAQRVAEATNWARDLVNEPANVLTPTRLAQAAQSLAREGLKVTVGGRKEIQKQRMGMFLAVAQGSAEEPRLIHVAWVPKNARQAKRPPLALVGKAITFDSGGLSLKTNEGMLDMKVDMAGSAAVLGAMKVVAALQPPFPVHAFIGACENMPSGTSYKLGDVLTSRLGKTVEITNTDAEGRLVLGDVLAWACEHKPALLVDLATLTGACVIALGNYVVGAFGENEAAVAAVLEAGRTAGESLWRLPLVELQRETLRSEVADMKNTGERWGGAITAALFLKEFVGDTPWVHLDIAGPATSPKERGYHNKGATGVGVRTLVELVRQHSRKLEPEGEAPDAEPKADSKPASKRTARSASKSAPKSAARGRRSPRRARKSRG